MDRDETYVKVGGQWKYLYRAVDKAGNTVDFLLRAHRDKAAARGYFEQPVDHGRLAIVPFWDYAMFMRIIAKRVLLAFCDRHPLARQSVLAWHEEAVKAVWMTPQDINARYPSASFVGQNRVVFNIKGNDYRLIVAVAYRIGIVYIKFVGTHGEYDRIDAETVELE